MVIKCLIFIILLKNTWFWFINYHKFILVILLCYRYVATAVTSVHEMENGFNIWSFNGKHLYRILKDHFFQVITISFLLDALLAISFVLQWCKEGFVDVHCLGFGR